MKLSEILDDADSFFFWLWIVLLIVAVALRAIAFVIFGV